MASSSLPVRTSSPSAASSPTSTSSRLSSAASTPSGHVSPSRGLKRARDVDDSHRPSPPATEQAPPPTKRHYENAAGAAAEQSVSPSTGTTGDASLRISNELLRSENDQLQQRLQAMETEKSQQKQRIRNLEEDLTRIYKRQKRDAETRQVEHARALASLRQELERMTKQLEDQPVVDPTATVLTAETTQEMDAFVAMCAQWQRKLTAMTANLTSQVSRMEQNEVRAVMQELVTKVGQTHTQRELRAAEERLEMQRVALCQQQDDMVALVAKIKAERDEMETFEALERHVLEERVAELEKNAAMAEIKEKKLHQELQSVQSELVKHQRGVQAQEAQWKDQIDALTVRCEAQTVQLTLLREDLASMQSENDELAADLTARKRAAAEDGDSSSIITQQLEDRITELKDQLADAKKNARDVEANLTTQHAAAIENMQNRIEVLNLNVEAKAKVIEGLSAEKIELLALLAQKNQAMDVLHTDMFALQEQLVSKNQEIETLRLEVSEAQEQMQKQLQEMMRSSTEEKLELQRQMEDSVRPSLEIKQLQQQVESTSAELSRVVQEKTAMETQNEELRRLEAQWLAEKPKLAMLEQKHNQLLEQTQDHTTQDARVRDQIATIERENRQLKTQVEELTLQTAATTTTTTATTTTAVDAPPLSLDATRGHRLSPEIQTRIAKLLVEKRAVEHFVRCYFDTAEAKCQSLSKQVAVLEAQHATSRQRARDSCQLLRLCAQVDACDGTMRASLMDVMTTLESMS